MKTSKNLKKLFLIVLLLLVFFIPEKICAQHGYPRLANHYLKWGVSGEEAEKLAKWDVLILDPEGQEITRGNLEKIKKKSPETIILPYISPQEISNKIEYPQYAQIRVDLIDKINQNDWWLRNTEKKKTSFWDGTYLINVTEEENSSDFGWNDYLPLFVKNKILVNDDIWDGVFYDSMVSEVPPIREGSPDIDEDGVAESKYFRNKKWREGLVKILNKTRQICDKDTIIVGNSAGCPDYQKYLNGRTFESFPTPWEGDGSWEASMRKYLRVLPEQNRSPLIYTINSNTANTGKRNDYRKMRFGLTSTLLGNGYFSFDHGDESHAQLWWYDEYEQSLGVPVSPPYNLLDKYNKTVKPGLWRRDFKNGIVVVNSTNRKQTHYFRKEEFEKINGTQCRSVNSGARVNWVELDAKDGIMLLKTKNRILNNSFNNGNLVRIFNKEGKQERNSFFSYIDRHEGGSDILISNIDNNNGEEEVLVNKGGDISIYRKGQKVNGFSPYEGTFKGEISFSVSDLNGDGTKEIITGTGSGGGPLVRIFNKNGKPLTGGFFAYPESFRGGVDVAVMDLNGDGTKEIITGAGPGGSPHIRVFTKDGEPLTSGFFAFPHDFKGGVTISAGNIDGEGDKEIIIGAGGGMNPEVKVFSKDGVKLDEFMAFGRDVQGGVNVMAYDINDDGKDEILVGTKDFN